MFWLLFYYDDDSDISVSQNINIDLTYNPSIVMKFEETFKYYSFRDSVQNHVLFFIKFCYHNATKHLL